jgi:hypothetical protein
MMAMGITLAAELGMLLGKRVAAPPQEPNPAPVAFDVGREKESAPVEAPQPVLIRGRPAEDSASSLHRLTTVARQIQTAQGNDSVTTFRVRREEEPPAALPVGKVPRPLLNIEALYFEKLAPGFSKLDPRLQSDLIDAYDAFATCCPDSPEKARLEFMEVYKGTRGHVLAKEPSSDQGTFTAYDCESTETTVRTIDLREPGSCDRKQDRKTARKPVQTVILQTDMGIDLTAYQCTLIYSHYVHRCGFDSISYGTKLLAVDRPYRVTPAMCRAAIKTGTMQVFRAVVDTRMGGTEATAFYSRGQITDTFSCQGVNFVAEGISWTSSVEEYVVSVTIKKVRGTVYAGSDRVIFSNGIHARNSEREVVNDVLGTLVWDPWLDENTPHGCRQRQNLVYHGPALVVTDPKNQATDLEEDDILMLDSTAEKRFAAFPLQGQVEVCGLPFRRTQIPGLVVAIYNTTDQELASQFSTFVQETTERLDASAPGQVESAVAELEASVAFIHINRALVVDARFAQIHGLICRNERSILATRLAMIASSSGAYALLETHGPGHLVSKAGAAALVHQCAPRLVRLRATLNCTQEIPVEWEGSQGAWFADPVTLVLKRLASPAVCSPMNPVYWRIAGQWVCSTPQVGPCARTPGQLQPTTDDVPSTDDYSLTKGLVGGLYSPDQKMARRMAVRLASSREAAVAEVTMNVLHRLSTTGSVSIYSEGDFAELQHRIGIAFFPLYRFLGENVQLFFYGWFILALVSVVLGMLGRIYLAYRVVGVGWWLVASIFHLAFTAVALPVEALRQVMTAARARAPRIAGYDDPPGGNGASGPKDDDHGKGSGTLALRGSGDRYAPAPSKKLTGWIPLVVPSKAEGRPQGGQEHLESEGMGTETFRFGTGTEAPGRHDDSSSGTPGPFARLARRVASFERLNFSSGARQDLPLGPAASAPTAVHSNPRLRPLAFPVYPAEDRSTPPRTEGQGSWPSVVAGVANPSQP